MATKAARSGNSAWVDDHAAHIDRLTAEVEALRGQVITMTDRIHHIYTHLGSKADHNDLGFRTGQPEPPAGPALDEAAIRADERRRVITEVEAAWDRTVDVDLGEFIAALAAMKEAAKP